MPDITRCDLATQQERFRAELLLIHAGRHVRLGELFKAYDLISEALGKMRAMPAPSAVLLEPTTSC